MSDTHAFCDLGGHTLVPLCMLLVIASAAAGQGQDLRPETLEDFHAYAARVDERFHREVEASDRLHRFDYITPADRGRVLDELSGGGIFVTNGYVVRDAQGRPLDAVRGGRIHHWYAAVFIPGVTIGQVLSQARAYDRHAELYQPDVVASAVEQHDETDDTYLVYYRFQSKTAWVTATLDTTHRIRYFQPAPDRAWSVSQSIRVQQVNEPGPAETLNPEGVGRGYMWATNSYWRFRQGEGGVYVEIESVALTSNPWIVRVPPFSWFVRNLPRNVLTRLLGAMRRALLAEPSAWLLRPRFREAVGIDVTVFRAGQTTGDTSQTSLTATSARHYNPLIGSPVEESCCAHHTGRGLSPAGKP